MKEEKVEFYSEGEKVFGILHLSNLKNSRAVIIMHGYVGLVFEKRFKRLTSNLCKSGFTVLVLIFRGYDERTGYRSEKHFKNLTVSGQISDLRAAVDFLYKRGYNKIGIAAECFGGIVAILLNDPRINALSFWSTSIYTRNLFKQLYGEKIVKELEEKGKAIYTSRTTGKKYVMKKDFWDEIKRIGDINENKIKRLDCPMLIVCGDKDKYFDKEVFKDLYNFAKKPKKLVLIKDADHIFSDSKHLKKMINSVTDWFDKWLK
jgi:esterase/lipase